MSVATAKKTAPEIDDADRTDGNAPPDEDLAAVLADMPHDATVAVRRVAGGKQEFIANMDAATLTEEYAAREFGPGQYKAKYSWPDANGRRAYRAHRTLVIADDAARRYGFYEKKREDRDDDAPRNGRSRGDIVDAGIAGLLTASAEAMRAQREGGGSNMELIVAMMKDNAENARAQAVAQAAAAERTTTLITTLIGSLVPVLTAVITRKADDPVATAKAIAEIMKPAGNGNGGGMKDALESLALVLDMKDRLAGTDEATDVPTALIKNFAGPFARLVEAYTERKEQPAQEVKVVQHADTPAPPARLPAPATTPAPAAAPATPQSDGDMMLGQLKDALRGWVQLAKAKRDPSTYAQVTWDEFTSLPKHLRDIVIGFLSETVDGTVDGDFALEANAAKFVPEVAQYPEWFGAFFDELRVLAGIIDDVEPDDEPATPAKPAAPAKGGA